MKIIKEIYVCGKHLYIVRTEKSAHIMDEKDINSIRKYLKNDIRRIENGNQ